MMKRFVFLPLLAALVFPAANARSQDSDGEVVEQITVEAVADAVATRISTGIKARNPLKLSDFAKPQAGITMEYAVMLRGVALFYDLHEAELRMRSVYEAHSSAYVRWGRARENLRMSRVTPRDVAKALALVEKTRLVFFKARTRVNTLRLDLQDLTGIKLPEEFSTPPSVPSIKLPDLIYDEILAHAKMTRAARNIRRAIYDTLQDISNSWQAVITAQADLDYLKRELLYRQQIYQQDRATSLGSAMTDQTAGDADLVRAIGRYRLAVYRLSILLGNESADNLTLSRGGLDAGYPFMAMGIDTSKQNERYVPKSGSGFGQDDQP